MNNIIEFVPKNNPEVPEEEDLVEKFLCEIAPDTDQIIFLRVNKEGNTSLGHTPLAVKDLIIMYHQMGRYINVLLESEGDMFYEDHT